MISRVNLHIKIVVVVILIASLAAVTFAQSGRSWMNGVVVDQSETDPIVGAEVQLIGDPDNARLRNVKLSTKTDEHGKYSFTNVPYGDYTFRVSAPGFTTYEVKFYLLSDSETVLHAKLRKIR